MLRKSLQTLVYILWIGCGLNAVTALAADDPNKVIQAKASELKDIKARLSDLQSDIQQTRKKKSKVSHDLKTVDLSIGKLAKDIKKTQGALAKQQKDLKALEEEEKNYQKRISKQRELLAEQLRIFYYLGQQEYLKVLLHPENTQENTQALDYYHYLYQARLDAIQGLTTSIRYVQTLQQDILKKTKTLQELRLKQIEQQADYKQNRVQQEKLVQSLNKQLKNNNQQIAQLMSNKKALEKVIVQTQQQPRYDSSARYSQSTKFANLRGKLPWPTKGRIISGFHTAIAGSTLKTNGVLIAAPLGQNVIAIAPGKVIFADWLKGYGLLTIIDQGNNYLSLYGHNNTLFKKAGDYVKAGMIIAEVGQSGGQSQSGLYFEIREKQTPINPARWCRK